MAKFQFSDRSYSCGAFIREVRIIYGKILLVITQDRNDSSWDLFFYDISQIDGFQYLCDYKISLDLANKIIKEASEYHDYLYARYS